MAAVAAAAADTAAVAVVAVAAAAAAAETIWAIKPAGHTSTVMPLSSLTQKKGMQN